ncbi:hypothetical protein [Seohaeicola zhoushanensis]|uniref:Uncharacterized protein n=1 Tax=Seohaeicola zhoushanensis TaxID=1569283 RepID=A0A8J3H3G6_9RHOB|nr:hypothetical protein [Seohaeicola zhoushanensis]GHF72850.1 hypothetical protein GCM10017056_49640 [Seohaeicola zhoushanensis]
MKRTILTAAILAASLGTAAVAETQKAPAAQGSAAVMTHGNLISELKTGKADSANWASEIAGLESSAQVEIVKLSELKGEAAENSAALDTALTETQADAGAARTAIEANAELKGALEAESFTAEDVVMVQVDGANQVTLVVDDRS